MRHTLKGAFSTLGGNWNGVFQTICFFRSTVISRLSKNAHLYDRSNSNSFQLKTLYIVLIFKRSRLDTNLWICNLCICHKHSNRTLLNIGYISNETNTDVYTYVHWRIYSSYCSIGLIRIKITMYMKKCHSGSPNLGGRIPLLHLEDVLGALGVEFLFCNAGGTVGMASTGRLEFLVESLGVL